ncbi:hypothetical protein B0H17DRAFT_1092297, partial [Mycena rosella]
MSPRWGPRASNRPPCRSGSWQFSRLAHAPASWNARRTDARAGNPGVPCRLFAEL